MNIRTSRVLKFWIDARHLMNELADLLGAALVVAASEEEGFIVFAGEDLADCERAAHGREILEAKWGG